MSPKFTLFGGSLLSFTFGSRGKGRGRGRGGLAARAVGGLRRAVRELGGKDTTAGKIGAPGLTGRSDRPGGADSFARFRDSRPDLFDDPDMPGVEGRFEVDGDQGEGQDDDRTAPLQAFPEGADRGQGRGTCDFCQGTSGHHWHGCPHGGDAP